MPQLTLTTAATPHPSVTPIKLLTRTPRTPQPTPTEDASAQLTLNVISPDNITSLAEVGRLGDGYIVYEAAWAPGGNFFALATSQGVFFYDAATCEETRFSQKLAETLSFSPDGERLAIGRCGYDSRVMHCTSAELELWQLVPKRRLYTQKIENGIAQIAFHPMGSTWLPVREAAHSAERSTCGELRMARLYFLQEIIHIDS